MVSKYHVLFLLEFYNSSKNRSKSKISNLNIFLCHTSVLPESVYKLFGKELSYKKDTSAPLGMALLRTILSAFKSSR